MRKYLIIFFILGIIFRLWSANLIPQPFVFDQTEYHNFALQILDKGLVAWQTRLYGYPLFLATVYKLFGVGNFGAVAVIQTIFDCFTAVLIYLIAKKIFKDHKIVFLSFILYLFNPFTSVFVVLTLSEVFGIFLMTLITYLLILTDSSDMSLWPRRKLFLVAFLLGYLPQVRMTFLIYSVVVFFWLVMRVMREIGVIRVIGMIILFLLPFTYNIAGNWVYFKQFSPTTVDNLFVREFYISLYVPGRSPFHAKSSDVFPPEVQKIYNEYSPVPQNSDERKAMAQKYLNLGLVKVADEPIEFISSRLAKFWYVWEKHFLFYYTQPENKPLDFATYWGNNLLLAVAFAGFILWRREKKEAGNKWFGWLFVFTVLYISVVHSMSLAEERYSLPGYPLTFLFAGYGIYVLTKWLRVK